MNETPKTWPHVADMDSATALAWGEAERQQRMKDLAVRTPAGLRAAQDAAAERRKAIGASQARATELVIAAGRAARREAATKGTS